MSMQESIVSCASRTKGTEKKRLDIEWEGADERETGPPSIRQR